MSVLYCLMYGTLNKIRKKKICLMYGTLNKHNRNIVKKITSSFKKEKPGFTRPFSYYCYTLAMRCFLIFCTCPGAYHTFEPHMDSHNRTQKRYL